MAKTPVLSLEATIWPPSAHRSYRHGGGKSHPHSCYYPLRNPLGPELEKNAQELVYVSY